MKPENYEFGGGVHYTIMHPAVLVATVVTILLMLLLPRKYVVIPFCFACFWSQRRNSSISQACIGTLLCAS